MAAGTTSARARTGSTRRCSRARLILVVGVLAVIFDTTIVSVALHTLAAQLHTSVSTIQWVTTGYLLALGIAVPLSAWGLQRFGGKRLWMFALAVFLVGSIGSSLAWNVGSLIAWRVVQGVGGGIMLPLLTTLIMQAAGGKALGRTVTIIALPALLGPILGPLVGGAILTHFSWRFMFWVNVPFCVVGLILAARYMPADTRPGQAAGRTWTCSAWPCSPRHRRGHPRAEQRRRGRRLRAPRRASSRWPSASRCSPRSPATRCGATAPLMDVRLLARRPVASASAVLFFSGFALYGAMLLLPLYYQEVRGVSAADRRNHARPAGRRRPALPRPGRTADRQDRRPPDRRRRLRHRRRLATIPFAFAGTTHQRVAARVWLVVRGFGLGAVTIPVMAVAFIGLDKQQIAQSSVLTRTAQQIGGSFGTAVLAVILSSAITAHHGNLAAGFDIAFWWATGFSALAVLLSLWLPGSPGSRPQAPAGTRTARPGHQWPVRRPIDVAQRQKMG